MALNVIEILNVGFQEYLKEVAYRSFFDYMLEFKNMLFATNASSIGGQGS